jgi:Ner family transcriptional regulator
MIKKQSWDRYAIQAEIHRRGATLTGLALQAGIGSSSCRVTLSRPVPKADRVIAEFLGIPLHELWPCRYDAAGNRLRVKRKSNSIRGRRKSRDTSATVTEVTVPLRTCAAQRAEEAA